MSDLVELVKAKFGEVSLSSGKNGSELVTRCPYCGRRKKFYLNPQMGTYFCQRCREGGQINSLLSTNIVFDFKPPPPKPLPDSCAFPGTIRQLSSLEPDHTAIVYLRNRGCDPLELQNKFGVCYCEYGRVYARIFDTTSTIIMPIWMYGRAMGWQARLLYNPDKLTPGEREAMGFMKDEDGDFVLPPKCWTSPGLEKGRVLFNFDVACTSEIVVVTEGPFDAMKTGACAVATLGTGVSDQQLDLVQQFWKCAVVLLDPDAHKESTALANRLRLTMPTVHVQLKGYKDPGDAPRTETWSQIIRAAHDQCVDLSKYKVNI